MRETQHHFCNTPVSEEQLESKYEEISDHCILTAIPQLGFNPQKCQSHEIKVRLKNYCRL